MTNSSGVAALKRWSCLGKEQTELPVASQIKAIHIYDFDNTLFCTSLPNAKLWTASTVGMLMTEDTFANGGWFHDNRLLEATGKGMAEEEPRAWDGYWNEDIVKLVEMSMKEPESLTVLLTGRGERKFADVIKKMIKAKKLEFDLVCLKPSDAGNGRPYGSTMGYKQILIKDLVGSYGDVDEVRMYEDRPKHTQTFRTFLSDLNLEKMRGVLPGVSRKAFTGKVIQVSPKVVSLDPIIECTEVQKMINDHNATGPRTRWQMKRTIFFTGYLLTHHDTDLLIELLDPALLKAPDIKVLANNIMITPKPATEAVLDKVGGMGAKQIWQVQALGNWNGIVYAVKVSPIPSSATVSAESPTPMVVLATLRGAKAIDSQRISNWQPVSSDKQFVFETTVGEKVQLRIEEENLAENEYDSLLPKQHAHYANGSRRKDDNYPDRRNGAGFRGGRGRDRDRGDRRDRNRDRDTRLANVRGGGNNGNRGDRNHRKVQQRTGNNTYRSLDDHGRENGRHADVDRGYDQNFPPLGSQQRHNGGVDGADDGGLHY